MRTVSFRGLDGAPVSWTVDHDLSIRALVAVQNGGLLSFSPDQAQFNTYHVPTSNGVSTDFVLDCGGYTGQVLAPIDIPLTKGEVIFYSPSTSIPAVLLVIVEDSADVSADK